MRYYIRVFKYAYLLWVRRLREGKSKVIGFIIQTTLLFSVLYYLPSLGDLKIQIGTTGALVIAILASGILNFVFDLLHAPVLLDLFQRQDLKYAINTAKDILNSENRTKYLGDLYNEGKALRHRVTKELVERDEYLIWFSKCEKYIEDNYEYSELHKFRNSSENNDNTDYGPQKRLMNQISWNLNVLDNMIQFSRYNTFSRSDLQLIVLNAEEPGYKYVLGLNKD